MADLLKMSSDIIDRTGNPDFKPGPVNRINHELSVLTDRIAMVEAFSHCILFKTDDGLVAFDTSNQRGGLLAVEAVRKWSPDRFNTLVYTHGHIDHVGGAGAFIDDAASRKDSRPNIVGHENVANRFDRYDFTNGYNMTINQRQFLGFTRRGFEVAGAKKFLPETSPRPDLVYTDCHNLSIGGLDIELRHAKGETDDHTWAWIPEHKAICAGDFFIWSFPNAGNPQKVQRYPLEWAAAMRRMAEMEADLFLPAHGLPIQGKRRITTVLLDVADALEYLVQETVNLMNQGARLNDIVHSVSISEEVLAKPYLAPVYDEPEFVVRNIWRMYGGWYDGNPANLKPAKESVLAIELAELSGGADQLARRAQTLADVDIRTACHLVEFATLADPENNLVHGIRAEIYQARREQESSLMAKGIFGYAAGESEAHTDDEQQQ